MTCIVEEWTFTVNKIENHYQKMIDNKIVSEYDS
jgi:hypothetical protein